MTIEGHRTVGYGGLVLGEATMTANTFEGLIRGVRDTVGGISGRAFTWRKDRGRPWKSTI